MYTEKQCLHVCRPHWGHSGRVEIKIKNSAIKLIVLVTKSTDGHPVIKATGCEVDLHLSIHVHGSGRYILNSTHACFHNLQLCLSTYNKCSWLYKLFRSKLERELKKTLKSKICEAIYATPTEWNSVISSFPCKHNNNWL